MEEKDSEKLLDHLIKLAGEVSMGHYGRYKEIYELTKTGKYPPRISKLAESFGMMMVKIEAREFRLEQLIEDLKKTEAELTAAKEVLDRENLDLKQNLREKFSPGKFLGKSRTILDLIEKVKRIADTSINVLIIGETGTGKDLIAKSLHFNSMRLNKPFVAVNCSSIPEPLIEAELFGIEKGVATGVDRRMGKMEQASCGTLFLDEVGDMPLTAQAKVLRAIEDKIIERVGGRTPIPVDIRIIAATNKDLKKEVEKGNFRKDLFYRLNVVRLNIPPLRERRDDIPLLLNAFLELYSLKMGRPAMKFSREVVEYLKEYPWPGNVRELENEMERAVALAYSNEIKLEDLSEEVRDHSFHLAPSPEPVPLQGTRDMERRMIAESLLQTKGNKSETARRLGISREGLRKKLKRYGLE